MLIIGSHGYAFCWSRRGEVVTGLSLIKVSLVFPALIFCWSGQSSNARAFIEIKNMVLLEWLIVANALNNQHEKYVERFPLGPFGHYVKKLKLSWWNCQQIIEMLIRHWNGWPLISRSWHFFLLFFPFFWTAFCVGFKIVNFLTCHYILTLSTAYVAIGNLLSSMCTCCVHCYIFIIGHRCTLCGVVDRSSKLILEAVWLQCQHYTSIFECDL